MPAAPSRPPRPPRQGHVDLGASRRVGDGSCRAEGRERFDGGQAEPAQRVAADRCTHRVSGTGRGVGALAHRALTASTWRHPRGLGERRGQPLGLGPGHPGRLATPIAAPSSQRGVESAESRSVARRATPYRIPIAVRSASMPSR